MQKMQTLLLLTQQSLPNFRPHGNWLWLTLKKVVVINSVGWNHLCWWSGFEIKSTSKEWFCLFQVFCEIKKQTGTRRKNINSLFGRGFNSRHLHQKAQAFSPVFFYYRCGVWCKQKCMIVKTETILICKGILCTELLRECGVYVIIGL